MKPNVNLNWMPGNQLPEPDTCVLIYTSADDCYFTAFHTGESWLTWTPNGDDVPFHLASGAPDWWAYTNANRIAPAPTVPCDRPPEGWYCTREAGHSGPCAAHEGERPVKTDQSLEDIIAVIEKLTDQCEKTLEQRGMKLAEETGEVIKALLIETGSPGARYREYDPEAVLEECSDVFIVVMSIIYTHLNKSYPQYKDEFVAMLTKKLGKWQHILMVEHDM